MRENRESYLKQLNDVDSIHLGLVNSGLLTGAPSLNGFREVDSDNTKQLIDKANNLLSAFEKISNQIIEKKAVLSINLIDEKKRDQEIYLYNTVLSKMGDFIKILLEDYQTYSNYRYNALKNILNTLSNFNTSTSYQLDRLSSYIDKIPAYAPPKKYESYTMRPNGMGGYDISDSSFNTWQVRYNNMGGYEMTPY